MASTILSLTLLSLLQHVSSASVPTSGTVIHKPVAAAWYADWHTEGFRFPLSSVSWKKYNTLIYSFAETTPNVGSLKVNDSLLSDFVGEAHEHGVAAHISIGGWGGSRYFSSDIATSKNRTAFVQTIAEMAQKYHLDGINFSWEYPGKQGIGCNTVSANDTAHFFAFLRELRKNPVGANLTLSASTFITPFVDATGNPSKNVSRFAEVLDYIAIMNFDIWGSWSPSVGPNSPLNDTCAPPADQEGSAVSAVKAWTAAGMPADQIVLAVAAYGHSYSVSPSDAFVSGSKTELAPYPKFNIKNQPLGDAWDDTGDVNVCGVNEPQGGTFRLWGLVSSGFLTPNGEPASGIHYRYDGCSQTPYVYDKNSKIMISFENAQSFGAKGEFIKNMGLRGFSMWEAGGDYHDILLDSIRSKAGYGTEC